MLGEPLQPNSHFEKLLAIFGHNFVLKTIDSSAISSIRTPITHRQTGRSLCQNSGKILAGTLPGSSQKLLSSPATIRWDPPWGTAIFAQRSKFAVPHRGAGVLWTQPGIPPGAMPFRRCAFRRAGTLGVNFSPFSALFFDVFSASFLTIFRLPK